MIPKKAKDSLRFDPKRVFAAKVVRVARVRVIDKDYPCHTREDVWVAVDVAGEMQEVLFVLNQDSFVRALKQVPDAFMAFVHVHGVGRHESAHQLRHPIGSMLLHEEMEMIGHEAVGHEVYFVFQVSEGARSDDFDIRKLSQWMGFVQRLDGGKIVFQKVQKHPVILIVNENIGFVYAAIIDVIKAACDVRFDGVLVWHYF